MYKIISSVLLLNSLAVADIDIQKNIYDGAEDIIRMDEKMNRAIAEHNQLTPEEDAQMRLNSSKIEDFEDIGDRYILKKDIPKGSKVELKVEDGMLNILTITTQKEKKQTDLNISYTSIINTSEISIPIPNDANQNSMQKDYKNGILEIIFYKK
ncbi:MAG: hypothetical protein GXO60_00320 [Epsilonproteobacteria bacterium]|nr:hypothetical protein [Campylobacterota bacterium]